MFHQRRIERCRPGKSRLLAARFDPEQGTIMTTSLTTEIHPFLVDLAQIVAIRNETKAAIAESDAGMADAQQRIEQDLHRLESAHLGTSNTKLFYANTLQQITSDRLACHRLAKQLLEAHLTTVDSRYLEIESDLKAKIMEVSGGDQSLFAIHVPERPADISPV
jgi:hypothetical protein